MTADWAAYELIKSHISYPLAHMHRAAAVSLHIDKVDKMRALYKITAYLLYSALYLPSTNLFECLDSEREMCPLHSAVYSYTGEKSTCNIQQLYHKHINSLKMQASNIYEYLCRNIFMSINMSQKDPILLFSKVHLSTVCMHVL